MEPRNDSVANQEDGQDRYPVRAETCEYVQGEETSTEQEGDIYGLPDGVDFVRVFQFSPGYEYGWAVECITRVLSNWTRYMSDKLWFGKVGDSQIVVGTWQKTTFQSSESPTETEVPQEGGHPLLKKADDHYSTES